MCERKYAASLLLYCLRKHQDILTHSTAYFIVPVDITTVEEAVKPYSLIPLPTSDKTLFPNGFPAGKHPVLVSITFQNDIRMTALQIPTQLLGGAIEVPYVDRLGDRVTGFLYSVKGYIGGYKGSVLGATVPGKRRPR